MNLPGMNSIKFNRYFKTEEDCLKYIADIKWEHGYECRNCGNTKYIKGSKYVFMILFYLYLPRFFIGYWILNGAGFSSWPLFFAPIQSS